MLVALGKQLHQARQAKGLSLEAVAGAAKISAAYLHKLERGGVANPSPRVLSRLAPPLGLTYLQLMQLAGYLDATQAAQLHDNPAPTPHPLANQRLTPEEWRAVGAFIAQLRAQRSTSEG